MPIHLAQLTFGIDFILPVYQQVVNDQSTPGANAKAVFYDP